MILWVCSDTSVLVRAAEVKDAAEKAVELNVWIEGLRLGSALRISKL